MRRLGSWLGASCIVASFLLHPLPGSASQALPAAVYRGSAGASYTVRSGDTVWALAKRFGLSVNALNSVNHLTSDYLETGQILLLPGGTYTVRPGDTIWTLARTFGVSVDALNTVNHLTSDYLETGQVVRLPGWPLTVTGTSSAFEPGYGEVSRGGGPFDRVIGYALRFQGVPYVWGGSTPSGFDCSGLVQYVFRQAGINLPRDTWEQYTVGVPVAEDQLQPGDIVFFNTVGPITHDGIYIGNGHFISSTSSDGVAVRNINDDYWGPRYAGARRL